MPPTSLSARHKLDLELLLDWLRSISQYRMRLALIFCGVKAAHEMGVHWTEIFVNVERLKVSFLPLEAAHKLITLPVSPRTGAVIFTEDLISEIQAGTHCHHLLVQALCSLLIEILNEAARDCADMRDIAEAKERLFVRYGAYFWEIWQGCNEEQRQCLLVLRTSGRITRDELAQGSGVAVMSIDRVLDPLMKRDIVIEEQSCYRLTVPLVAEWITTQQNRFLEPPPAADDPDDV